MEMHILMERLNCMTKSMTCGKSQLHCMHLFMLKDSSAFLKTPLLLFLPVKQRQSVFNFFTVFKLVFLLLVRILTCINSKLFILCPFI